MFFKVFICLVTNIRNYSETGRHPDSNSYEEVKQTFSEATFLTSSPSHHQICLDNLAHDTIPVTHAVQTFYQQTHGDSSQLIAMLIYGGQQGIANFRQVIIRKPTNRNFIGYPQSLGLYNIQHPNSGLIITAKNASGRLGNDNNSGVNRSASV